MTSAESRPLINYSYEQLTLDLEQSLKNCNVPAIHLALDEISRRSRTKHKYNRIVQRANLLLSRLDDLSATQKAERLLNPIKVNVDIESNETLTTDQSNESEHANCGDLSINDTHLIIRTLDNQASYEEREIPRIDVNETKPISLSGSPLDLSTLQPSFDSVERTTLDSNDNRATDLSHEAHGNSPRFIITPGSKSLLIEKSGLDASLCYKLKRFQIYYLRDLNGLTYDFVESRRSIGSQNLQLLIQSLLRLGHLQIADGDLSLNLFDTANPISSVQPTQPDVSAQSELLEKHDDKSAHIDGIEQHEEEVSISSLPVIEALAEISFEDEVDRNLGEFF